MFVYNGVIFVRLITSMRCHSIYNLFTKRLYATAVNKCFCHSGLSQSTSFITRCFLRYTHLSMAWPCLLCLLQWNVYGILILVVCLAFSCWPQHTFYLSIACLIFHFAGLFWVPPKTVCLHTVCAELHVKQQHLQAGALSIYFTWDS